MLSAVVGLIQQTNSEITFITNDPLRQAKTRELNALELNYIQLLTGAEFNPARDYTLLFALRVEWYYTNVIILKGEKVLARWVTPEDPNSELVDFNHPEYGRLMKELLRGTSNSFTVAKAFIFRPATVDGQFQLVHNWNDDTKETVGFLNEFGEFTPFTGHTQGTLI